MNLFTQRSMDRIIGAALCRFLSLFPWKYKRVHPGFTPRNILIIILSEMGSVVLSKPMFDLIGKRYPQAAIYLLVFERNKGVLEVLDLAQGRNVLTIDDRSFTSFLIDSMRVLIKLHRIEIDTVFDCELFSRAGSLFSLMSGAKARVGFHAHRQEGLYRGDFINLPVLYNPYIHISLQFASMVESLHRRGMPLVKSPVHTKALEVQPAKLETKERARFLAGVYSDFGVLENNDLVLLHPGGGLLPIREWPLQHYCELAKGLLEMGYAVGVIGMEQDRPLAGGIANACRNDKCLDLTGYTKSVRELVFLFQIASLLIANDGGPGHFASLTSTPSIIFYGPETPALYGTLGNACLFYAPLSCSPCLTAYNHRNSPCDGDNQCLKRISPESVLKKVHEMKRERLNPGVFNPFATG